jgi:hypothetical protein
MKLAIVLLALCGCASFIDDKAASSTLRILEKSMQAAPRQADLELARAAMPGGIMQLEALSLAYPDHRGFRMLHANALCQYAVMFGFDDWEAASFAGRRDEAEQLADRLRGLLATCADAQRALLPVAWRDATTPDAIAKRLPSLTREQVPHVLWLATTGAVLLALDPMANLAQLPAINAQLARCTELAPGFRNADAEVLLGTLQAGQASFFGGKDGSEYFARARKLAGEGVLNVDVMFARGVAVARKDRALFTSTLERVLGEDLRRWPEQRLANEVARKKALRYLAAVDMLVPD